MNLKNVLTVLVLLTGGMGMSAAAAAVSSAESLAHGDRLWAQGKLSDARAMFEQAANDPVNPLPGLMKLGGLLLSNQDFAAAIATYKKVIGLDGNNVRAWMGLGMAYLHTQQKELSRAAFGEAVRIEPSRRPQLAGLIEAPKP